MSRNGGGTRTDFFRWWQSVLLLSLLVSPACFRGGRGAEPVSPPSPPPAPVREPVVDNGSASWIDLNPVVVRLPEPEGDNVADTAPPEAASTTGGQATGENPPETPAVSPGETAPGRAIATPPAEPMEATVPAEIAESHPASPVEHADRGEAPQRLSAPTKKPKASIPPPPAPGAAIEPSPAPAPAAAKVAPPAAGPAWARRKEELVYRVDFIGITMGYARFRYQGKVSVGNRVAYHLNVRAWTSGVLSYIYPVNETIDYYLDVETMAPLRQEFTQRQRDQDDVATYEQDTGKITYRYRDSGEVRKRVETVPLVYDPVSVAYYFRWRDLGEERSRNVYAGRKVWQISARVLGKERIRTDYGEVDTVVIRPVIRRDGKLEDKGDLKMWLSSDERHVPVRLYAKFRKIRDWTLVGELVPQRDGG